jgi:steroid delta-isomerase-like uncharacterized protein
MSTEENKALVRRVFEELLNKKNLAAVDESYAAGYVYHGPGGQDTKGPEAFKQLIGGLHTAFPDFHDTIEDQIAEGDKVVTRFIDRGTHQGEFQGIAPTGKRFTMTGLLITRIQDGKIAEEWEELDLLGLMQQLGAIPAPA